MLAAVYRAPEGISLREVAAPSARSGEIILRVDAASICGTDLRILHGAHRMFSTGTVRIPGHEISGTISQIGAEVNGYEIGQRVFAAPNWGCGHCRMCIAGNNNLCPDYGAIGITHDGAFAEYVRIPAPAVRQGNVIPISDQLDPAAGCSHRAIRLRAARAGCPGHTTW